MGTLTTRQDQEREIPRRRAVVMEVNKTEAYCICWDSQSGQFNVQLSLAIGPIVVWPAKGEEWYCVKISGDWYLERRTSANNPAFTMQASPGDLVLYNPNGRIILRDKDGAIGGSSGVRFGQPVTRRIEPGTTYKSVQVLDAATGEILGYMPLYQ